MFSAITATLFVILALCPASLAQGPVPDAPIPDPSVAPASSFVIAPEMAGQAHKFWDRQNKALFLTAAALNTADFAITHSNLQSGGQELNPVVRIFGRSSPVLALNFAGETGGLIAVSYFFHKTGHHKLERFASIVDIGASSGAVGYGLATR